VKSNDTRTLSHAVFDLISQLINLYLKQATWPIRQTQETDACTSIQKHLKTQYDEEKEKKKEH